MTDTTQTQQPVAMIAPDYSSVKMVPADQIDQAGQAGWEHAAKMVGPKGENKWVPYSQVDAARQNNFAVQPQPGVQKMVRPDGQITYALPNEVDKFKASGHQLFDEKQNADAMNARPWYRKMLGLGPEITDPQVKAREDAFWADQKVRMAAALKDDYQAKADVPIGVAKAAGQSGVDIANLGIKGYDKVTGNDKNLTSLMTGKSGHEIEMPKWLELHGENQYAGAAFENVLEFMLGDEALKGLSTFQKLEKMTKTAKILQEYPALAKLAHLGVTSVRQGIVGGTQNKVHGGDFTTGALISGGTGVASDLGVTALQKIAPKITKLGGVKIPVLASQAEDGIIPALAQDATKAGMTGESQLGSFMADQQKAVQKGMGSVARDVTDKGVGELNESINPQTMSAKEFAEATDTKNILSKVNSFNDGAEQLKAAAKTKFSTIDELTNGDFSKLQEERSQILKNLRNPDLEYEKVTQLRSQLSDVSKREDKLFDQFKLSAEDKMGVDAGRKAWKQATAMEELGELIDAKTKGVPQDIAPLKTADGGIVKQTPSTTNGQGLREALKGMDKDGTLKTALGNNQTHREAMINIADLLSRNDAGKKLPMILRLGRDLLSVGSAGSTEVGSFTLGKILTNPKYAQVLSRGLKAGVSASAIANMLVRNIKQDQPSGGE